MAKQDTVIEGKIKTRVDLPDDTSMDEFSAKGLTGITSTIWISRIG